MFKGTDIVKFFQENSALAVFLTVAIGFWIGKFRFGNFSLGIVTSVLLVGVVVNNAILLVDVINQLRAAGDDKITAVLKAGPLRLRAIMMTTVSTLIGTLPVALALSEGGETRQPMSVAVIGGLATSTLLTLLVIPVVYLIFDDLTDRVKASVRRLNAYRRLKSQGRGA